MSITNRDLQLYQQALNYVRIRSASLPYRESARVTRTGTDVQKLACIVVARHNEYTWNACRADADSGNIDSMLDFALRKLSGLGTHPAKDVAALYLHKVISSLESDDRSKAMAHVLLLECLGVLPKASEPCPSLETLTKGAFHADEAARLGFGQAPNVLSFGGTWQRASDQLPEDIFQGRKYLWKAIQERADEIAREDEEIIRKREARPNRYQCAAADCHIVSNSGKALRQCGGKCDVAYKPFYCSSECQRKHWRTHKEFCKPDTPVHLNTIAIPAVEELEILTSHPGEANEISHRAKICIPIKCQGGKVYNVSASPHTVELLKRIKKDTEAKYAESWV